MAPISKLEKITITPMLLPMKSSIVRMDKSSINAKMTKFMHIMMEIKLYIHLNIHSKQKLLESIHYTTKVNLPLDGMLFMSQEIIIIIMIMMINQQGCPLVVQL